MTLHMASIAHDFSHKLGKFLGFIHMINASRRGRQHIFSKVCDNERKVFYCGLMGTDENDIF